MAPPWRAMAADARIALAMDTRRALDGVIQPQSLFRVLRSMAMEGIRGAVADRDREGKDVREHVFLFFDARPLRLSLLAVTLLQLGENVSAEQAEHELERAAAEAEREGRLLGAGGVLSPDLLLITLAEVSTPGTSLAVVEDWLAKPCPPNHARLVMLAETMFSLEHVPIVRAN